MVFTFDSCVRGCKWCLVLLLFPQQRTNKQTGKQISKQASGQTEEKNGILSIVYPNIDIFIFAYFSKEFPLWLPENGVGWYPTNCLSLPIVKGLSACVLYSLTIFACTTLKCDNFVYLFVFDDLIPLSHQV